MYQNFSAMTEKSAEIENDNDEITQIKSSEWEINSQDLHVTLDIFMNTFYNATYCMDRIAVNH